MSITDLWNLIVFQPMLNGLIVLYTFLFSNLGIAIVVFTVIVRLLMLPLTMKQLHASKMMSSLQPRLQELQKKYSKDRQRLSQEQMKLYKEYGVNPMGCLVPTVIQFPIWIGLYQSVIQALPTAPEGLLELSQHLYPWLPLVNQAVPLGERFLWLNLAQPDTSFVLPILVAASMWVQQKMMTMPTTDPKQKSMNDMMQWMMPALFGFFTVSFASGLAIYWVASNIISIVIQYFVTGWGTLFTPASAKQPLKGKGTADTKREAKRKEGATANPVPQPGKGIADGKSRGKRKDSGGGSGARPKAAQRQPLRSRGNGSQPG